MDFIGYNIYRRSLPEAGYTRRNADPVTDTSWVDTALSSGIYFYRVSAVDLVDLESALTDSVQASPLVDVQADISLPIEYRLEQNYPNPFNAQTSIAFELPKASHVSIEIFDVLGRKVATLLNEQRPAGENIVTWDAGNQPSGLYSYKIKADDFAQTKKMLLVK